MSMSDHVYIIAEAGVNHNGDINLACKLIDAAKEAGADAVKFQTFNAKKIASANADKAEYQKETTDAAESQLDMLQRLELSRADHDTLLAYCKEQGIEFLSTPFDLDSVDLLVELGVSRLKVPSGELTNGPLVLKMARTGLPLILSTGMAMPEEIEAALGVMAFGMLTPNGSPGTDAFASAYASPEGKALLAERVCILHCTTQYPTPLSDVNLRGMDTLASLFGLPVGYSDHTQGITVPVAAAARGAMLVEKHFTLDKNLPGPDHKASLEPHELTEMVTRIRQVQQCLGNGEKKPQPSEIANMAIARKSLVAAAPIKKGDVFTEENLTVKRPGTGISPMRFWEWLGKVADSDFAQDDVITE